MKLFALIVLLFSSFSVARADGGALPTDFDFTVSLNQAGCQLNFPSSPCDASVSGGGSFTTTGPINTLSGGGFLFVTSITGEITINGTEYTFSNSYGLCDASDYSKYGPCSKLNPEGLDGDLTGPGGALEFVDLSQLWAPGGLIDSADLSPILNFADFPADNGPVPVTVTLTDPPPSPMPEGSSLAMLAVGLAFVVIARRRGFSSMRVSA